MDELVGEYQRLCIAYGGQDARVGMIPAVEHQCGFRAEKVCQFGFQLFVNGEVARQQPGRRRGGQERVGGERAQEFLAQGPVGCQPQVVVGREVQHAFAVHDDIPAVVYHPG